MIDFLTCRHRLYSAAQNVKKGIPNPRFDTSDIAQESILQLLNGPGNRDEFGQEVSNVYLRKVGEGNTRQMMRKNLAKKRSMNAEVTEAHLDQHSGSVKQPFQVLQEQEEVVALLRSISQLPLEQQRVISRRYFDQKTLLEIANEMETTIDIVRNRYQQAIRQIRKQMSSHCES